MIDKLKEWVIKQKKGRANSFILFRRRFCVVFNNYSKFFRRTRGRVWLVGLFLPS
jgi:hypothetical protein